MPNFLDVILQIVNRVLNHHLIFFSFFLGGEKVPSKVIDLLFSFLDLVMGKKYSTIRVVIYLLVKFQNMSIELRDILSVLELGKFVYYKWLEYILDEVRI